MVPAWPAVSDSGPGHLQPSQVPTPILSCISSLEPGASELGLDRPGMRPDGIPDPWVHGRASTSGSGGQDLAHWASCIFSSCVVTMQFPASVHSVNIYSGLTGQTRRGSGDTKQTPGVRLAGEEEDKQAAGTGG